MSATLHHLDSPETLPHDATIVCAVQGDPVVLLGDLTCIPAGVAEHVRALVAAGVVAAEPGSLTTSHVRTDSGVTRVMLVTLGAGGDGEAIREAFGAALSSVPAGEDVAVLAPDDDPETLRACVEGSLLGDYVETVDSRVGDPREPRTISVLSTADAAVVSTVLARATVISEAVAVARDLGNAAPSALTPEAFAEAVRRGGGEIGLDVTVLDEEGLRASGCGGILGVGQGSQNPPRLVRVAYEPREPQAHLAFVGKGITFDSGGLGIKNRAGMLWMKCDMGGAAAVYAAVLAICRLGLPIRVTGWLALAENMPSGTATKPGDVLHMRNGATVEVTDTDAEGRLVLADGLAAATEEEPDLVVDVATLTGAQIIALGQRTSAVMARQDAAAEQVLNAANASGEPMWRLPMPQHLRGHLRSSVADLANMGGTDGGVIVGAHFLEQFVPDGQPWVHVDIAGPAINTVERYGYTPHGATGAGVRTLVQLAEDALV